MDVFLSEKDKETISQDSRVAFERLLLEFEGKIKNAEFGPVRDICNCRDRDKTRAYRVEGVGVVDIATGKYLYNQLLCKKAIRIVQHCKDV